MQRVRGFDHGPGVRLMRVECGMRGCKRSFRDASAAALHVQSHRPLRADEKSARTLKFTEENDDKTGVDSPKSAKATLDTPVRIATKKAVSAPSTHVVGEYWATMIYPCKCYCHFYEKGEINPCNEKGCETW